MCSDRCQLGKQGQTKTSSSTSLGKAYHTYRQVGDSNSESRLVSLQGRSLFWTSCSIFWIQWEWHCLSEILNQFSCLTFHSVLLTVCFSLQVQTSLLWQSKVFWLQQYGNANEKTSQRLQHSLRWPNRYFPFSLSVCWLHALFSLKWFKIVKMIIRLWEDFVTRDTKSLTT